MNGTNSAESFNVCVTPESMKPLDHPPPVQHKNILKTGPTTPRCLDADLDKEFEKDQAANYLQAIATQFLLNRRENALHPPAK